jgi:ribosomal protein S8
MHIIIINAKNANSYCIDLIASKFRMKISQIVSKMDYLYV